MHNTQYLSQTSLQAIIPYTPTLNPMLPFFFKGLSWSVVVTFKPSIWETSDSSKLPAHPVLACNSSTGIVEWFMLGHLFIINPLLTMLSGLVNSEYLFTVCSQARAVEAVVSAMYIKFWTLPAIWAVSRFWRTQLAFHLTEELFLMKLFPGTPLSVLVRC